MAKRTSAQRERRERLADERRAFVVRVLIARPVYEWPLGCRSDSQHVHERLTRARGGSIVDDSNVLALCAAHHRRAHDYQAEATALGVLLPSRH